MLLLACPTISIMKVVLRCSEHLLLDVVVGMSDYIYNESGAALR